MMAELETWRTETECATVRTGDTQADVSMWPNSEGVTVGVTGPHGANVLSGSLRWEQMEALCAAFALLKAR